MHEEQKAVLREWLSSLPPMPEPEACDDAEVSAALAVIAQGFMVCWSRCCHPSAEAEVLQQVAQGEMELAEVERRYRAYAARRGIFVLRH
jgi:hypothetical protein